MIAGEINLMVKVEPFKLDDRVWALLNEVQSQNRRILAHNTAVLHLVSAVGYVVDDGVPEEELKE